MYVCMYVCIYVGMCISHVAKACTCRVSMYTKPIEPTVSLHACQGRRVWQIGWKGDTADDIKPALP